MTTMWTSILMVTFLHLGTVSAVIEGEVRLTGNNCHSEGRVEIYHSPADKPGRWGTICHDGFYENEAKATCRQLGFDGGATLRPRGEAQVDVWLSVLECSANAHNLTDCLPSTMYWDGADQTRDCGGRGTAGVHCYNTDDEHNCEGHSVEPDGGVKINSTCDWKGQLLYYTRHRWVQICADGFDDNDAAVACRQLGYMRGWAVHIVITHQEAFPLMMSDINCQGQETRLSDCPAVQRLYNACRGDNVTLQRAAVTCSNSSIQIACGTPLKETCETMHCHTARCVDGPEGGHCLCPPFLHGKYCDQEVTPCLPNPCLNNGTCSESNVGFKCTCASGFSGHKCQKGSAVQLASMLQPGLRAGLVVLGLVVVVVVVMGGWCLWHRRRQRIPRRRFRNEEFRELAVSEMETEEAGHH